MTSHVGSPFTDVEWAARSADIARQLDAHSPACVCARCVAVDDEVARVLCGDSLADDERGDLVGHSTPTVGRIPAYQRAERAGEA